MVLIRLAGMMDTRTERHIPRPTGPAVYPIHIEITLAEEVPRGPGIDTSQVPV